MRLIFLQIPKFPTKHDLWRILAGTRVQLRHAKGSMGKDHAACYGIESKEIPGFISELENHEILVMKELAKMGETV